MRHPPVRLAGPLCARSGHARERPLRANSGHSAIGGTIDLSSQKTAGRRRFGGADFRYSEDINAGLFLASTLRLKVRRRQAGVQWLWMW